MKTERRWLQMALLGRKTLQLNYLLRKRLGDKLSRAKYASVRSISVFLASVRSIRAFSPPLNYLLRKFLEDKLSIAQFGLLSRKSSDSGLLA